MSSGVRDSLQVVKIVGENGFTSEWLDLNERLTSSLRRGRLSLLVGSGISQYAPCTVPYAGEISSFLTSGMLEALPPELHSEEYSSAIRLPFEVLMARLAELDTQVARDIAFILTDAVHPNPVHEQIATIIQHCAEGAADFSVITTNYDTGITCGIAERKKLGLWPCGLPIPRTVTRPEDIDPPCSGPEIFHVHGITTDLSTLVLDYKEEFSLASWKKAHLAELVRDRDLFIVGFSGWDLDICKALAECEPSSIAWLRRDELECANWSRDAREVLDLCPVIAVNAENDLQNVLSHLAGTAPRPLTRSEDQIRRRFTEIGAKYNIPEQPWFRLWARWTILRAGFANAAWRMSPEELNLIPKERSLEFLAFGYYYSGLHASGALQQRKAARAVIDHDIAQYLYFRNNEVEYLNRGAYTPIAIWVAIKTLVIVFARVLLSLNEWSPAASAELRNLITSPFLAWPLLCIYRHGRLWNRVGAPIVSILANIVKGADLDKYNNFMAASPDNRKLAEAEAQYLWLGQGARLINWYRFTALQKLRQGRRSHSCSTLREACNLAQKSLTEAHRIEDRCRLGKSQLVYLESLIAIQQCDELTVDGIPSSYGVIREEADSRMNAELARTGWENIERAEIWRPYFLLSHGVYCIASKIGGRTGSHFRILALALLETS